MGIAGIDVRMVAKLPSDKDDEADGDDGDNDEAVWVCFRCGDKDPAGSSTGCRRIRAAKSAIV